MAQGDVLSIVPVCMFVRLPITYLEQDVMQKSTSPEHDSVVNGSQVSPIGSPLPRADDAAPQPLRTEQQAYTYYKEVFAGRPMPFAYVDLDLLDQNIRLIAGRSGGKNIRIASKSVRSVAILRRILQNNQTNQADSCFQGIMCFTAREAVFLAEQGFDDLLIGYPAWHEADLTAVARAVAAGTHITLMIDGLEHVRQIEAIARRVGTRLPLCLDIDMTLVVPGLHFGVWRSPLRTAQQARPIVEYIRDAEHIYLDGVMGYEAQIAGLGDNVPGKAAKNTLVRALKKRSLRDVERRRAEVVALVKDCGLTLRFVNGGGTGSLTSTNKEAAVTEVTVGSGFFSPVLFDYYKDFRYQPAAGYAIEVVRQPAPGIYTCLGGGYTASGAAGADKLPKPYLPAGAQLDPLEGAGEVQTPIRYHDILHIGDPVFMRHSKAGELCERFTRLLLVSNGEIVDEVTTYRGDQQCFL